MDLRSHRRDRLSVHAVGADRARELSRDSSALGRDRLAGDLGLALLSKESAIHFPAVVAILTLTLTRRIKTTLRSVVPFAAVLAGYMVLRYLAVGKREAAAIRENYLALHVGQTALNLLVSSVRVLLPPLPEPVEDLLVRNLYMSPRRWIAFSLGGVVLATVAARLLRNRSRWKPDWQLIPALAACFVVSLPLLGTLRVSLSDTQGERVLYFPSVFVAIGAVCLASRIPCSRRALTAGLGVWLVAALVALWQVNGTWAAAGRLARALATETAALASGDIVIVANLPLSYRGAWGWAWIRSGHHYLSACRSIGRPTRRWIGRPTRTSLGTSYPLA